MPSTTRVHVFQEIKNENLNPTEDCVISIEEKKFQHWLNKDKSLWSMTFFLGAVFMYAERVSMSIAAPAIAKELGWNKETSGKVLSAFFGGYILTNISGGSLSDRIGGQIVIFYTSVGWGLCTLLLPFLVRTEYIAHSGMILVLFARFLTGFFQGVFFPSITSILIKHVPNSERGSILGFIYSGMAVGTTVTGFFGSIIVEHQSWDNLFLLVGILALLWTLWLRRLISLSPSYSPSTTLETITSENVPWLKLASCAPFWGLLVAYFMNDYCFYNLLSWTPLYFHDTFPESKGWIFNVIPWLVSFALSIGCGHVADFLLNYGFSTTFVRKLFTAVMLLGTALFSILLTYVQTFQQALLIMSLNVGVQALISVSVNINSADLAPKHAGALHGFMNCSGAFAGFIGVYLTGYILETTQLWSSVFQLTGASAVIGFLFFQVFGSGERII